MTASLSKAERVVHVDFSRARHDVPPKSPDHGTRHSVGVVPPERRRGNVQGPDSIVAVAHLIVAKANADTVDGDLEMICRMLRQNCAWSDESLILLKRTVASALDRPRRAHPPGGAG